MDYEDEFYALLMLVLEMHSLRTTDASFAESLYGLRRRTVKFKLSKKDPIKKHVISTDANRHSSLEKRQKVLSVVFLVKLFSLYLFKVLFSF